ncbi:MAG: HlyD family efflux transporter periplasmic adaptor subunit [Anaerolineae bacterium]|nr:HlyD family efflux transporter periplasmic adaptor subunit [Anaerolineae bacterium]
MIILLGGCAQKTDPTATPVVKNQFAQVVSVTGEVIPATWATLSSKSGGTLVDLLVEPGDLVAEGDLLARLDTADLELALKIAQENVAVQQASLNQLLAGASEAVIARADRDNAYQLDQAEITLQLQQQQLEQARQQDLDNDVAIAQANIRQLEAQIAQAAATSPAPEVKLAQVELERAKIALDDTQDEYNKALDRPWEDQDIRDGWAKQLKQVKLNYESAQAQLDRALNAQRAHTLGQNALSAQLEAAKAALAKTEHVKETYALTLGIMETEITSSQTQIVYLESWDNPYRDPASADEIARIEALLRQAELAAAQVEQQIGDAELRAPFGGTVGMVYSREGEIITPGQPLVILGDLTTLRVETTDLDEIDIAEVELDQRATLTFDAFPDQLYAGRVTRISPMAESGTGGVHYTVIIELDALDDGIKWGMTAFVDIEAK